MSKQADRKALVSRTRFSSFSPLALIVVCVISLGGLIVSAWAWLAPSVNHAQPIVTVKGEATAALPPQSKSKEPLEAEVITVSPNGFEPTDITRPKGRFILLIRNKSGAEELAIQLARENGNQLNAKRLPKGQRIWSKFLDLPPGLYVLTEANHPGWACRIKLTSN